LQYGITGDLLQVIFEMYVNNTRQWRTTGLKDWDHYFFSLLGGLQYLISGQSSLDGFKTSAPFESWASVSYSTAGTRGQGLPSPHWQPYDNRVARYSGYAQGLPLLPYAIDRQLRS
jgi:hypothetical protein